MTELYERLGVGRDAHVRVIKRAYRNLSKTHHPDIGGDPNVFAPIAEAWEILSDLGKRAEYDMTGVIPQSLDRVYHEALGFLAHTTEQAINQMLDKRMEDLAGDLVEDMKGFINERINEAQGTLSKLALAPKLYSKMRERIKPKDEDYDGPNPILGVITQREEGDGKKKAQVEHAILIFAKAIELLDKFGCDFPKPQQNTAMGTVYTFSTGSWPSN